MKAKVLALLVMFQCSVATAGCPIGSYDSVDEWGNRICKSYNGGGAKSIEGSTQRCPTGTYSTVDGWGNKICKSYNGGGEWHDTSKGCPTGSYQSVDEWGNKVCKKF